eukprot:3932934-Pyramimonas_sp.AAC.1
MGIGLKRLSSGAAGAQRAWPGGARLLDVFCDARATRTHTQRWDGGGYGCVLPDGTPRSNGSAPPGSDNPR